MNQENTVIESIMGNSTSLASAMRVYNAIPDVQAKLIEKLTEQLKQKFNEKSYLPTVTKMGSHRYAGFDIDCSSYGIEISFEFQKANYNELCMGYRMMDKQYQKGSPKFNELAEKVRLSLPNKNMKISDTWLGWYIPKFGYWQKDIEIKKEVVYQTNTQLFRSSPDLKAITTTGAINPTLSPNGNLVIFSVASASASVSDCAAASSAAFSASISALVRRLRRLTGLSLSCSSWVSSSCSSSSCSATGVPPETRGA